MRGRRRSAHRAPGRCTGRFVNPITDICWSCLFPILDREA
jgi:conjugal transfer pilus assembly protein TraU